MVKIYQGNYPKKINVVINGKVYTTAEFIDGVYETTDKKVIKELTEYGYTTDGAEEPVTSEKTSEEPEEDAEEPVVRPRRARRSID